MTRKPRKGLWLDSTGCLASSNFPVTGAKVAPSHRWDSCLRGVGVLGRMPSVGEGSLVGFGQRDEVLLEPWEAP